MSTGMSKTHELKCHPAPFAAVMDGSKPFEWRKDDRGFQVGDTLHLKEWDPRTEPIEDDPLDGEFCQRVPIGYTGRELFRRVTYIIRDGFGIPPGYCIMGIAELDRMEAPKVLTTEALWQAFKNELVPDGRSESIGLMFDQPTAEFVLRYARDSGYLAPAPGLTVEEVMDIVEHWRRYDTRKAISAAESKEALESEDGASGWVLLSDLRARLTAALTAKSRTA